MNKQVQLRLETVTVRNFQLFGVQASFFFFPKEEKNNPKSCFMCCPGNSLLFAHSSYQRELILNVRDFSPLNKASGTVGRPELSVL